MVHSTSFGGKATNVYLLENKNGGTSTQGVTVKGLKGAVQEKVKESFLKGKDSSPYAQKTSLLSSMSTGSKVALGVGSTLVIAGTIAAIVCALVVAWPVGAFLAILAVVVAAVGLIVVVSGLVAAGIQNKKDNAGVYEKNKEMFLKRELNNFQEKYINRQVRVVKNTLPDPANPGTMHTVSRVEVRDVKSGKDSNWVVMSEFVPGEKVKKNSLGKQYSMLTSATIGHQDPTKLTEALNKKQSDIIKVGHSLSNKLLSLKDLKESIGVKLGNIYELEKSPNMTGMANLMALRELKNGLVTLNQSLVTVGKKIEGIRERLIHVDSKVDGWLEGVDINQGMSSLGNKNAASGMLIMERAQEKAQKDMKGLLEDMESSMRDPFVKLTAKYDKRLEKSDAHGFAITDTSDISKQLNDFVD